MTAISEAQNKIMQQKRNQMMNRAYPDEALRTNQASALPGVQTKERDPDFTQLLERIYTATKRIEQETQILNGKADALFGCHPECDQACANGLGRSGVVGQAMDALDGLHEKLGALSAATSRFENIA